MTQVDISVSEEPKTKHMVIRFNAHINWDGRAAGLPELVHAFVILENPNKKFIDDMIEGQSGAFIRSQSMYVQKDQGAVIDLRQTPQDRILIPFHNIAFIDVDVFPLGGELSMPDENGVERLSDGSEPVKN